MALSGSFYTNVGSRHRLQIEWSASQNVSANNSRVTARLYWISLDGYGDIYSGSSDPASITINGNTSTVSRTASLSGNQKRLLHTHAVTVPHNSDGTKTFTLSAYFDIEITYGGTYWGRRSISDSITLNTIPRESTLSSSPSWTAGKDMTISVSRHSTSFRHVIMTYVKNRAGDWVHVNEIEFSTSKTSGDAGFSSREIEYAYKQLDGRVSADTRVVVDTYSGSTFIGSTNREGTVYALDASYPVAPNSFNIGDTFDVHNAYYSRDMTHEVRLKNGSTVLKSMTIGPVSAGTDSIVAFSTSSIASALYALVPTTKSKSLTIEVITRYGSEQVKSPRSKTITAKVVNSNPTFSASPTYVDINGTTTAITGNSQYIIANKSSVRVTLASAQRAVARNGASMVRYTATLAGESVTKPYSSSANVVFDFGTIDAKTNQTIVISAVDSRGNSTPVTKIVTVIPYSEPGVAVKAERVNGFEETTVISLSGTLSNLKIAGVEKNAMITARYRTKGTSGTAWSAWATFPTTGFPGFTGTDRVIQLNRLNSYDVQVEVTDKLGTTSATRTVSSGKPLMFIDELLGSIGMGEFPTLPNQLLLTHQIDFAAGRFGRGNHAMDLNKGNVFGANAFFFQDETTGSEGFNFLKPGRPEGSRDFSDYDTLHMVDGALKINGVSIAHEEQGLEVLWEGAWYMHSDQTVAPSKTLSHCPTGWILVWCEYSNGSATNAGWTYTHVPKHDYTHGGALWIPASGAYGNPVKKYIYIGDNALSGHSQNTDSPNNQVVLRYVLPY